MLRFRAEPNLWMRVTVQGRDALRESIDRLKPKVLTCCPVSTRVNRTDNDGAELIEPVNP